jgi:hypothetical protein
MTVVVDVSLLRRALRLVHCLQKERGASCAVCASDDVGFQAAMTSARGDTDVAAFRLYGEMSPTALDKIRSQIGFSATTTTSVHRMLLIFNTLICNVGHEYILQYLQPSREDNNNTRRGYLRQRSNTCDGILFQDSSQSHRYQSDNLVPEFLLPHYNEPNVPSSSSLTFCKPMSDPHFFMERTPPHVPPTNVHVATAPARCTFVDKRQDRTQSLVNLLGCLVRLKESTGMQRAVFSSMIGRDAQMLVTTLILEVENQRKLVAELQQLPLFDYSLQKLVQDSIQMGPEMKSLHAKILNDFDVQGFQDGMMNSMDVWNMITVYMDKLHALELLLVEELEYCVDDDDTIQDAQQQDANGTSAMTLGDGQVLKRILGENVTNMSPEEIKNKLVECVGNNETVPVPNDARPPLLWGSEPPNSEAAAAATNEWQIRLDELQFKKRIGQGTAGTTYLAKWSGQTVAVKVACLNEMGLDGWKTRVQSLQRLHHPNVIRLLGSVYNENPLMYCLVLEFCNAGNLSAALQRPTLPNFFFRVAGDIASGLAYLH